MGSAHDSRSNAAAQPTSASQSRDGSLELQLDAPTALAGERFTVHAHVKNVGLTPKRLYLIRSEPFRFNVRVYLRCADAPCGEPLPPARAHGYTVSEADSPELRPGEELNFVVQAPRVPADAAGPLTVYVSLSNDIKRWPGGVQTLDGATRPLFQTSGEIPNIWTGELVAHATLAVSGR